MMRALALGLTCAALTGCAGVGQAQLEKADARLAGASAVASYRDLAVTPLKAGDPVQVHLGFGEHEEAAMEVDGETTFVRVFELPPFQGPYSVTIASHMLGSLTAPAIFYPQYVTLDESFREVRRSTPADFTYRRGMPGGDGLSSTLFVNQANDNERFLVVRSAKRSDAKTIDSLAQSAGVMHIVVPVGPAVVMWMVPTGGSEKPTPMRALAGGRLSLQLSQYKPRVFGLQ